VRAGAAGVKHAHEPCGAVGAGRARAHGDRARGGRVEARAAAAAKRCTGAARRGAAAREDVVAARTGALRMRGNVKTRAVRAGLAGYTGRDAGASVLITRQAVRSGARGRQADAAADVCRRAAHAGVVAAGADDHLPWRTLALLVDTGRANRAAQLVADHRD